jgi:ribosomal protein S18 acetylase RimI-like enzyme
MSHRAVKNVQILPIKEEHIEGFHKCIDAIARERKYLANVRAPSLESTRETVISNIIKNTPQYVAVDGDTVVGWCEILPNRGEGFTHSGKLDSMGLSSAYRGKGLGKKLIATTLTAAKEYGIERVELLVYRSNVPAIRFYEKTGFVQEGIKKNAHKLDGKYDDVVLMALFI